MLILFLLNTVILFGVFRRLKPKPVRNAPISKAEEFRHASEPLMEFLSHNYKSNVYATVASSEAMLIESLKTVRR